MKIRSLSNPFYPAIIVLLISSIVVLIAIIVNGGDPLVLARIGTRFSEGDPSGTQGYDGQFVYFIAQNPDPYAIAARLDVPAYRYQRILLPLLARSLSMGNVGLLPWIIPVLGILSLVVGAWAVAELLVHWGVNPWYALIYGLWAGFLLALITDLSEPLAYGLVACGILAIEREQHILGGCLLGLSVFAKEVTLLFVLAALVVYLNERQWWKTIRLGLLGIFPFAIFQIWLWSVFSQPGIGSGGAMATQFEWIPFKGLFRIGSHSKEYLLAMLIVFGPTILLPVMWGIWASIKSWLTNERNLLVVGLFINALVIVFTPFSTFRETGGIIRFSSGLVLSVLLFAGKYRLRRVMNYSVFWLVLNVFLLKAGGLN
jgi:hypothetical protein